MVFFVSVKPSLVVDGFFICPTLNEMMSDNFEGSMPGVMSDN